MGWILSLDLQALKKNIYMINPIYLGQRFGHPTALPLIA
jgi:hypothetical protein